MFQKYKELLHSIFTGITKGKPTATLSDYFEVLKYSFSLIGITLLFLFICFFSWKLPLFVWRKTRKGTLEEMQKLTNNLINLSKLSEEDAAKYRKLEEKLRNITIANVIGIACVYVPCVIPLILIFVDSVIRIIC